MLSRNRPAFALAELVIAAFVLAVGVLALEATALGALRAMRRSSDLALAASVARGRLERLAASNCADLANGADTVRGVVSTWSIEPTPAPSLHAVRQTISYAVDGKVRTDSYRSMFPCSP